MNEGVFFDDGRLRLEAQLQDDDDDTTTDDADCYDAADLDAFARGTWRYVGVVVAVFVHDVQVADAGLWGCEHGELGADHEVNALDHAVPDTAVEALAEAVVWLERVGVSPELRASLAAAHAYVATLDAS